MTFSLYIRQQFTCCFLFGENSTCRLIFFNILLLLSESLHCRYVHRSKWCLSEVSHSFCKWWQQNDVISWQEIKAQKKNLIKKLEKIAWSILGRHIQQVLLILVLATTIKLILASFKVIFSIILKFSFVTAWFRRAPVVEHGSGVFWRLDLTLKLMYWILVTPDRRNESNFSACLS